jgi:hypothetical protein
MMLNATLPLGVHLDQCFGWMAGLAQALPYEQREKVNKIFQKLISAVGETEITVQIPAVHILCQACDSLRTQGKFDEVAIIEELIKVLKGEQQRVIVGSLDFHASGVANLDDELERMRKIMIAGK